MKKEELEQRLIIFAVRIIKLAEYNKKNYAGYHMLKQIIRSATSVPLNYGEAQGGESINDFIHKMQIVLKELRETYINLRIVKQSNLNSKKNELENLLIENNELISIFIKSVETAKKNRKSKIVNRKL